jgi:hypothetical protein
MPFKIGLALKEATNGRPRYFIGKNETLQPNCQTFYVIDQTCMNQF